MSTPPRRENDSKRRFPTKAELDQTKAKKSNTSDGPRKLSRPMQDYSFMKDTSPEEYSPEQRKLSDEFMGHTADWLKGLK